MAQVLEVSKLACGNFKIRPLVLIVLEGSLEVMGSRTGEPEAGSCQVLSICELQ